MIFINLTNGNELKKKYNEEQRTQQLTDSNNNGPHERY